MEFLRLSISIGWTNNIQRYFKNYDCIARLHPQKHLIQPNKKISRISTVSIIVSHEENNVSYSILCQIHLRQLKRALQN